MALAAFVAVASLANLLLMQSGEGRGVRPERAHRGLSKLPGTTSTTVKESERGAAALVTGAVGNTAAMRARSAGEGSQSSAAGLVQKVQRALAARGYASGDGRGTLDIVTRAAIMAFEHDRRLTLTAEPSELLLAEIASDVPLAPSIAPGRQSDAAAGVVRTVQQALTRLNYQPGAADGVAGEATAAAIRAFERDTGMTPSGRISGMLVVRLAEAAGQTLEAGK